MESISYLIVSNGRIVTTNTSRVPSRKYHVISFLAGFDLAPSATFIAYYFKGGALISKRVNIDFNRDFNNFIELKAAPDQTRAGDNIAIDITTNAKNYVGLVAIDQSVLLLKKGNDLKREDVFNGILEYGTRTRGPGVLETQHFRDFSVCILTITNTTE